jgi:outer membrane protein TolC
MKVWAGVLSLAALAIGAPAFAAEAATAAPAARDVQLLDEVPNYVELLAHQWSDGVPQDVSDAEASTESYGRLLETPAQLTSLGQCIALALQNNTDLQIQRLAPVQASAGVRRARSVFDPALFATVTRDRNTTPATTFLTGGNSTTLFNQSFSVNAGARKTLLSGGNLSLLFNNSRRNANASIANPLAPLYTSFLGLTLNQPLLRNFGWRYSLLLVEVAQNTEQASYHQYEAGIANIIARVEQGYWALVLAIQSIEVQEQGLAAAREFLRQNEGKYHVGTLPATAVLEAKVDVANREALLIQFTNARDIARDNLRALINARNPAAAALIMIDPQDRPTVEPYDINMQRSLRAALEQRPELLAARLDIHGKGLQRKVAENQLLPQLNFVGSVGLNGLAGGRPSIGSFGQDVTKCTVVGTAIECPPPSSQPVANPSLEGDYRDSLGLLPDGRYYSYSAGASIDIPIGNAQAKADYAKANIDLTQSQLTLQQVQERVTLEITTAVSNLQSDLKSIEATRVARQLAEENLRNQKARYDVGLATTKDLLDYGDRLTRARFDEIQSLTKYNVDLAEMRRVEGSLLSARNVMIERATPEKAPWWASF